MPTDKNYLNTFIARIIKPILIAAEIAMHKQASNLLKLKETFSCFA
jgi:hypothetical protein